MSTTFTKLFASITESTIWAEPHTVRIVWITMLAMADRHGRVWASIPGLANRARVTLEDCEDALDRFQKPDKYSRTPDFEGRRIEPIDGGWRLLNHAKYRAIRDEESALEAKRKYAAKIRGAERKESTDQVEKVDRSGSDANTVDRSRDNAESDSEAEADSIKGGGKAPPTTPKQEELIPDPTPKVKRFVPPTREEANAYAVELGLPESEVDNFMDFYGCKGWKVGKEKMVSWRMTLSRWARKWRTEGGQNGRTNQGASLVSVDSRAAYEASKERMDPALVD